MNTAEEGISGFTLHASSDKTRDGASINSIERLNAVTLEKWEILDCVFSFF